MLWMDYNIRQFGTDFMIEGDQKCKNLYKPDVFIAMGGILR